MNEYSGREEKNLKRVQIESERQGRKIQRTLRDIRFRIIRLCYLGVREVKERESACLPDLLLGRLLMQGCRDCQFLNWGRQEGEEV